MQEITITLLCDKTRAETGGRREATQVRTLEYGKVRRRLDLCEEKARELDALLAAWLEAGQPEDARPTATANFTAGSKASRDFYAGLRAWADSEDRSGDYQCKARVPGAKVNYKYPPRLLADYEAHLTQLARAA